MGKFAVIYVVLGSSIILSFLIGCLTGYVKTKVLTVENTQLEQQNKQLRIENKVLKLRNVKLQGHIDILIETCVK